MLSQIQTEGQPRREFRLTPLNISIGAFLILALIGGVVLYIRNGLATIKETQEARVKATADLDQIKPMAGSVFVRRGSTASGEHGTVTDHYRSEANYESIRDYYLKEFNRLGWKSQGESKMLVRGQDVGAVELVFCKNGERADVFFVGSQETAGNITYTVGTGWGLGCGRNSKTPE